MESGFTPTWLRYWLVYTVKSLWRHSKHLFVACSLVFGGLLFSSQVEAVVVVYPDLREPYRSVFEAIIDGIEDVIEKPLNKVVLSEEDGDLDVNTIEGDTVIILGRQGMSLVDKFSDDVGVIVSAIAYPPSKDENVRGGIVLAPHPRVLFSRLKRLSPEVKNITVVYNPSVNDWLIEIAEKSSAELGFNLNAEKADDLRDAAAIYSELIHKGLGSEDAIWLPQDPYTVDTSTILPALLQASWDKEFVVFSSTPAHVPRGVLFALYPDNRALGRRIGNLALQVSESTTEVKNFAIQPLEDVLIAVNLRTADHLRLNLSNRQISNFDLTFPASR